MPSMPEQTFATLMKKSCSDRTHRIGIKIVSQPKPASGLQPR
jgi:hypothetical protein